MVIRYFSQEMKAEKEGRSCGPPAACYIKKRIQHFYIWLKNVCKEILNTLIGKQGVN